jgi:hypothetical protein
LQKLFSAFDLAAALDFSSSFLSPHLVQPPGHIKPVVGISDTIEPLSDFNRPL